MIATELLYGSLLLAALGVIGTAIQASPSAAEETSDDSQKDSGLSEIEKLRALHQVELVAEKDEGFGIAHLPNGVYGFSWAPQDESPLFRKRGFQSFEVHITADGEAHILGFFNESDAAKFASATEAFDVLLYPEPYANASIMACVNRKNILERKSPARDNGNPLRLKLKPTKAD
jgi:hypothetical protein